MQAAQEDEFEEDDDDEEDEGPQEAQDAHDSREEWQEVDAEPIVQMATLLYDFNGMCIEEMFSLNLG